jgi:hypothetical protein
MSRHIRHGDAQRLRLAELRQERLDIRTADPA